jgi:hypothetical protein
MTDGGDTGVGKGHLHAVRHIGRNSARHDCGVRYILVLQWPGSSEADFDELINMEDRLTAAAGPQAVVDGHDFGSGQMNIFISTDQPSETFAAAEAALRDATRWKYVRAAYREAEGESYTLSGLATWLTSSSPEVRLAPGQALTRLRYSMIGIGKRHS